MKTVALGLLFAVVIEAFHVLIVLWIDKHTIIKNAILNKVKIIVVFLGVLFLFYLFFSGFYTVSQNNNVVVTPLSGNKKVVEDVGLHYTFLGKFDTIDTRKQILAFPGLIGGDVERITTKDDLVVRVAAAIEFEIIDTETWSIKNHDAERKLYHFWSALVVKSVQSHTRDYLRSSSATLESEIMTQLAELERRYGVKIYDCRFTRIKDDIEITNAKSKAEEERIIGEAMKVKMETEKDTLKILYGSVEDKDFIKYIQFLKAVEGSDKVIMPIDGNLFVGVDKNE